MSQQSPAAESRPVPPISDSTANNGYSVTPAPRPGTVTAATVLAMVLGGLGVLAGGATLIAGLRRTLEHPDLTFDPRLEIGVLLIVVTTGSALFAVFAQIGRPGGRQGAIVFQGIIATAGATYLVDTLANLPFGGLGIYRGYSDLVTVVYAVLGGLAATSIGLLAARGSARWFREVRLYVTIKDFPDSSTRPAGLVKVLIFLPLILVIDAGYEITLVINVITGGPYEYTTTAGILFPRLATEAIPLILLIAGAIGIAVGNDFARIATYAACGFYCFSGALLLFSLPSVVVGLGSYEWMQLISIIASLATAVISVIAIFTLSRPQLAFWFDNHHLPPNSAVRARYGLSQREPRPGSEP